MCTNTSTAATSSIQRLRQHLAQNYLIIWLDYSIDLNDKDFQNTLSQLKTVANDVHPFTKPDECIDFLTDLNDVKAYFIIDAMIGQQIVPLIHDIPQLDKIYIFSPSKALYNNWSKNWKKIQSKYTEITSICNALTVSIKQHNQDSILVSFVGKNEEGFSKNLNELDPSFMYTQLFKEIILEINYSGQEIKNFTQFWRHEYSDSDIMVKIIDEFESKYLPEKSIWWYTRETFLYAMLNRSLRTMDTVALVKMGFFIRDLHHQIEALHKEQINETSNKTFSVYRGQHLSIVDFQSIQKNKGSLLSFNNFLSTSENEAVSLIYAEASSDMVSVLFRISIDSKISSSPFAFIRKESNHEDEEEILFSMHTIFRIGDVRKTDENSHRWEVQLTLTEDNDPQLAALTHRMREVTEDSTGWFRMGKLLLKVGGYNQAVELYKELLMNATNDFDKANHYHHLAYAKLQQGNYEEAVALSVKALEIKQRAFPNDHLFQTQTFGIIARAYHDMGDYSKALEFYQKALEIREKALPLDHSALATSYSNIGQMYGTMGDYSKAFEFHQKALKIREKVLPSNDPDLATSYNNICIVYNSIGNHLKALEFYEKVHEILKRSLPSSHPILAHSYNNIAVIYEKIGDYSKALEFHEKALKISKNNLPLNHPDLANSYSNIGLVYDNIGDYSKALQFHEKALKIREVVLPQNHPALAVSYNNISSAYGNMGDSSKALQFNKKALEIQEKSLPSNHPDLASSYSNIGEEYNNMGDYSKAFEYHEKALKIREKILPLNYSDLATSYHNIGGVYDNVGDYSKAFEFYEKASKIFEEVLPANHPNLVISYSVLGVLHSTMGDYSKALELYEKALKIREKILPPNHLDLAISYNDVGLMYCAIGKHSKALSCLENALAIRRNVLSPTHPAIKRTEDDIDYIKKKT